MTTLPAEEPLQIIMRNTAEDDDTVLEFPGSVAPDMDSLMDRDDRSAEAWQPRGLPATCLVDPEGQLRYQAPGIGP